MHRLVKRTNSNLIIVTYELRDRIISPPKPEDNPELITRLRPHTFGHFLKKHGLVPPNMLGLEFDEDELVKEEMEERKDPYEGVMDHKDD